MIGQRRADRAEKRGTNNQACQELRLTRRNIRANNNAIKEIR